MVGDRRRKVPARRVSRPLPDVGGGGGEGGADQSLTAAARAGEKPSAERQEADAFVRAVERALPLVRGGIHPERPFHNPIAVLVMTPPTHGRVRSSRPPTARSRLSIP